MFEAQLTPYAAVTSLPAGKVLVLAPHPDDETFGCAGAILCHVAQGDPVEVVIASDGRAARPHADAAALHAYIELRREEARRAARVLGYRTLVFWDIPDRELASDGTLARRVAALLDGGGFSRVYAPSVWEMHPDHIALADAAVAAVSARGAGVTLAMYEIGVPLRPNLLLDLGGWIERKRQAMSCYASQTAIQDYAKHIQALHVYRTYTLPPHVSMAEGYYQIDGATLREHPERRYGISRQTWELGEALARLRDEEARRAPELL